MPLRNLAAAAVTILLSGCAVSSFGDSGQSAVLPDGSTLHKYVSSEPMDAGGCQVAHGEALVQTRVVMGVPRSEVAGWALTTGPTTGCAAVQMAATVGAGVAGGAILAAGVNAIKLPAITFK